MINAGGSAAKFTGMPVTGDFAQTNICGASLALRTSSVQICRSSNPQKLSTWSCAPA
jgi:hypothetical protein